MKVCQYIALIVLGLFGYENKCKLKQSSYLTSKYKAHLTKSFMLMLENLHLYLSYKDKVSYLILAAE